MQAIIPTSQLASSKAKANKATRRTEDRGGAPHCPSNMTLLNIVGRRTGERSKGEGSRYTGTSRRRGPWYWANLTPHGIQAWTPSRSAVGSVSSLPMHMGSTGYLAHQGVTVTPKRNSASSTYTDFTFPKDALRSTQPGVFQAFESLPDTF
jgi:hypothetical protein